MTNSFLNYADSPFAQSLGERIEAKWDALFESKTYLEWADSAFAGEVLIVTYDAELIVMTHAQYLRSSNNGYRVSFVGDLKLRKPTASELAELEKLVPRGMEMVSEYPSTYLSPSSGNPGIRRIYADAANAILARMRTPWTLHNAAATDRIWVGAPFGVFAGLRGYLKALNANLPAERTNSLRRLGLQGSSEKPVPHHDTTRNMDAFFDKAREKFGGGQGEVIEQMPILPHGTKSSRTWGIEVEAAGARGVSEPGYWNRKYDGSLESAYGEGGLYVDPEDCDYADEHQEYVTVLQFFEKGEELPNGDIAEEDAYVEVEIENPDYRDPDYCDDCGYVWCDEDDDTAEFTSPVLHSFHSRGLEQLVEDLSHEPQNDSAGIHVHVGADDLTPKQIGALVWSYQLIEPLIEKSYRRKTRGYCRRRSTDHVQRIIRQGKRVQDIQEMDGLDRYVSLNLYSLEKFGTVEFRAMGPVYEYEHLVKWAMFCREMVNVAAADVPMKVWQRVASFDDVQAIFRAYGKESSTDLDGEIKALLQGELEEA